MKEESMKGEGDFANLPKEPVFKQYPKFPHIGEKERDDSITGIDETVSRETGKVKKYVSNQK